MCEVLFQNGAADGHRFEWDPDALPASEDGILRIVINERWVYESTGPLKCGGTEIKVDLVDVLDPREYTDNWLNYDAGKFFFDCGCEITEQHPEQREETEEDDDYQDRWWKPH